MRTKGEKLILLVNAAIFCNIVFFGSAQYFTVISLVIIFAWIGALAYLMKEKQSNFTRMMYLAQIILIVAACVYLWWASKGSV